MELMPTELSIKDRKLVIVWNDSKTQEVPVKALRDRCPCATCREKRSAAPEPNQSMGLPVISMNEAQPISILGMEPVGGYAYSIRFNDGHANGIYTFDLLRSFENHD